MQDGEKKDEKNFKPVDYLVIILAIPLCSLLVAVIYLVSFEDYELQDPSGFDELLQGILSILAVYVGHQISKRP